MVRRLLDALVALPARMGAWAGNLSAPALAAVGVVVVAGVSAGSYYAYKTYDYVQHDNDFCVSCHLMQEPAELFASSAHAGLGCKACHQPTLMARSQMALAQIVENPSEIRHHAEVPNELCANCHIEGDPERWRLIAASAGHKAHLESDDPMLQGLQCVECHSTSLHEFAPVDKTCAQSGCHEDKKILLAGMSDLTIHCSACHNFLAPVSTAAAEAADGTGGIQTALMPDREECFSCHTMRALVTMPDPDPHQGVCAACHNPHDQRTPAEAVRSCTNAGCHTQAADLSPMHRGMQPGVLEDCTYCHAAHDFKVVGVRCIDCHQELDGGSAPPRVRPAPATGTVEPSRGGLDLDGVGLGWWAHATPPADAREPARVPDVSPAPPAAQERPRFLHSQHQAVACASCHSTEDSHGSLRVVTLEDCRSCHHRPPVANDCARCHEAAVAPSASHPVVRPMSLSVGTRDGERTLSFPHARHNDLGCASCHTGGTALTAREVDCASCHEEHHAEATDCASCHVEPPARAHPIVESHTTCSGAGCHQNAPFTSVPRSRSGCLACHQDQREHRPGRVCIECHTMPSPRAAGREAIP